MECADRELNEEPRGKPRGIKSESGHTLCRKRQGIWPEGINAIARPELQPLSLWKNDALVSTSTIIMDMKKKNRRAIIIIFIMGATFSSLIFILIFALDVIILLRGANSHIKLATIPLTVNANGIPRMDTTFQGHRIRFLLDSGSGSSHLNVYSNQTFTNKIGSIPMILGQFADLDSYPLISGSFEFQGEDVRTPIYIVKNGAFPRSALGLRFQERLHSILYTRNSMTVNFKPDGIKNCSRLHVWRGLHKGIFLRVDINGVRQLVQFDTGTAVALLGNDNLNGSVPVLKTWTAFKGYYTTLTTFQHAWIEARFQMNRNKFQTVFLRLQYPAFHGASILVPYIMGWGITQYFDVYVNFNKRQGCLVNRSTGAADDEVSSHLNP